MILKSMILISVLITLSTVSADASNGSIEYIGDLKVLNMWGSWTEMGYAHGFLLGPDIKETFEEYFIELCGGVYSYEAARLFVGTFFEIPAEYQQYATGMISGVSDTISIYSEVLGRDMDELDIYTTASIPDISTSKGFKSFLCSSASAWGDATSEDPELSGSPAISRNLDFYVDTGGVIFESSILMTFEPDNGQDWVSICFPGFAGCLSGMNESGISACLNMGSYQGTVQYTSPFVPICMAQALGLSDTDFNGSGTCDVEDLKAALTEWNRANSYDIHVVADRNLASDDSNSVVVEVSNRDGFAFRYSSDEPDIAPCRMILTNHHRVLRPPVYCYRYDFLMDSLVTNPDVTLDRLWNFMGAVGWPAIPAFGGTLQSMIFMPEQLKIGLAIAENGIPSYTKDPEWILWSDLFPNHNPQGIEGNVISVPAITVGPNPTYGAVSIAFTGNLENISVYDMAGRKLDIPFIEESECSINADLSALPEGVYRITAKIEGCTCSRNLVLLR